MDIPQNKTPCEKCEDFLDRLHIDFVREFQDRYCPGKAYYVFSVNNPEEFVRNVLEYAQTHKDDDLFQSAAKRHLGLSEVRSELLPGEKIQDSKQKDDNQDKKTDKSARESSVSKKQNSAGTGEPFFTMAQNRQRYYSSAVQPEKQNSDEDIRRNIRFKLFQKPLDHDRYTRLTKEEKRFILQNSGLSKRERDVFKEKSSNQYLTYKEIAVRLNVSESRIKQIAVKIDKQILFMLEKMDKSCREIF